MMQVSNMVRIPSRDEALEAQFRQQQQFYSQPRPRVHEPAMMSNPYSTPATQSYGYSYQQRAVAPQSPPSPPGEEVNKTTLPSISSLLGMAEENQPQVQQVPQEAQHSAMIAQSPQYHSEMLPKGAGPVVSNHNNMILPPTPPLGPESIIDGNQSPSAISTHSAVSAPAYYMHSPMSQMDPSQHRHSYSAAVSRSHAMGQQSVMASPYSAGPYSASPYTSSPTTLGSHGPYYPSETPILPSTGLYHQRPLPSNFPPPMHMPMNVGPAGNGQNPWQHHHYISHSSQSAFPQSQDRYICPTCNKAFSRPSSLRIHSHSHTGEKPFKCSHAGCGKAFSVRSNMKRHERGCHASSTPDMLSGANRL